MAPRKPQGHRHPDDDEEEATTHPPLPPQMTPPPTRSTETHPQTTTTNSADSLSMLERLSQHHRQPKEESRRRLRCRRILLESENEDECGSNADTKIMWVGTAHCTLYKSRVHRLRSPYFLTSLVPTKGRISGKSQFLLSRDRTSVLLSPQQTVIFFILLTHSNKNFPIVHLSKLHF